MKNTIYLFLVMLLLGCNQGIEPGSYLIEGELNGVFSGSAFLEYADFKDTAVIENGLFLFRGILQKPEMCKIRITGSEQQAEFYLENSIISFSGHIDSLEISKLTGSKTENEKIGFEKILKVFTKKLEDIEIEFQRAEGKRKSELEELYVKIDWEMVEAQRQFIRDNPTSYLCIGILRDIDWSFQSGSEYKAYISFLDSSLNKYDELISLKEQASRLEKLDLGKIAPDFEINDANGELVRLSDIYANTNYLLLDFWASTCAPCRIENKHILEAYKKYHPKGFNVLGVSTDTKKELWLEAIEKDGLMWINTCNLDDWNDNELVKTYALRQVSANFLIDGSGRIVASNLRGEALHKRLAELFAE